MSVDNIKPSTVRAARGTVDEPPDLQVPVDEEGRVRVWLRHNVLGGTAGNWHLVRADHPELPRLLEVHAVAIPDANGVLPETPPRTRRGCASCR